MTIANVTSPTDSTVLVPDPSGRVVEIFSSLQGEGLYLGQRQIFVRLAGCPWRCRYCDTPGSLSHEGHPIATLTQVLEKIKDLQSVRPHTAVSVTGGEPLLQSDFLLSLLPAIHALGLRTYLETSATHPDRFRPLAPFCDVVAADIKLPSDIGRPLWAEHEEFLRLAGEKAFVKLVLTDQTMDDEFETAVNLLSRLTPPPPLILQPVTATTHLESRLQEPGTISPVRVVPPAPSRLVGFWEWARARLPTVKVISQMHPVWGLP